MKVFSLGLAVASVIALAAPLPADAAKANFGIFFGVPHYSHRMGPDYRFRPGFGWYLPGNRMHGKLSCGEAKWSVRSKGFRNVATVECRGATYTFRATRNGNRTLVYVNARSGAVWRA